MYKTDIKENQKLYICLYRATKAKKIECENENELVIDFGGQHQTEQNRISIILLWQITFEGTSRKQKKKVKTNYKQEIRQVFRRATNNTVLVKRINQKGAHLDLFPGVL